MFKKYLLCTALLLAVFSVKVFPSGIQVLNTEVTTNSDKKSAQVKFSLTWDHSWRLDDGPKNWDAAWVFIKYRTLPGDNWNHAYISTTAASHKLPTNASLSLGNSTAVVGGANTTVSVGAFIFRKAAGNGAVSFTDIELNWDFTKNGLTGGEQVEVCVLATEMVYIPQGPYYLGDYTSIGRFTRNRSSNSAALGGEAVIQIATANPTHAGYFSNYWSIYGSNSSAYTTARTGLVNNCISSVSAPVPDDANAGNRVSGANNPTPWTSFASVINTNFPRGFSAFYCMKYEVTQGEYVQFLNKNLVSVKNAGTYFNSGTAGRYAIVKKANTGTANTPAEYELSNPTAAYLPCNYLGTKDITAWLIWAGLRPMTELEFEKVCRGTEAIPGTASLRPQYAWGSTNINNAAGFANKGMSNEGPSNATGNCAVATSAAVTAIGSATAGLDGPMRAGGFATPVSSREKAGGSFYGVMEMSGNLWERCISVGNDLGRLFQGSVIAGHGNGEIGPNANPDLPIGGGWPAVTGAGLGFRGGSYLDIPDRARISDRYFINLVNITRHQSFGGRGVRTAL
ncbi:MAG: SUMF1/EgtB/PvdO family nonheme iron enzyme [Bacteroidales bacterium]|jgi:formylglycine-generating enzyme required for sulfatase activity|nr:SUMF1/EgtB/PvdO family nonheme iron enzyme [Bacteroidales bacterium]